MSSKKHQKTAKFCLQKQGIIPTPTPAPAPIPTPQPVKKAKITVKPAAKQVDRQPLETVITDNVKKLTIFNINKGAEGYAKFATEIIKDHISITKKAVEYNDLENNSVLDTSGKTIAHMFFKTIAASNNKLLDSEYRDIQRKVQSVAQEGRAGYVDITGMLTNSSKIYDTKMNCDAIARGEDNDFARDFIKYLHRFLGK